MFLPNGTAAETKEIIAVHVHALQSLADELADCGAPQRTQEMIEVVRILNDMDATAHSIMSCTMHMRSIVAKLASFNTGP